jgi:hypothetical protein
MKKVISMIAFVAIFSTTVFIGCKKGVDTTNQIQNISISAQRAVAGNTLKEIKQNYSLLSPQEKQDLFIEKWNAILENDVATLTANQITIINMLKDFGTTQTFENLLNHSEISDAFIETNLAFFQNNFDPYELYMLVECPYYCDNFSLRKSQTYLAAIDPVSESDHSVKCTCRYSIYCMTHSNEQGNFCTDTGCGTTAECGFAGTSQCTGECRK